ncbi:MAG: translation elongation factor Ts [Oscillospiraceae bacterium]|nr:translation elongation factor Ts [Oscillospiraceae bacterium]
MANFTAKDVNDLRKSTGVGLMDCKKALTEAEGDVEKAIVILREKGLANQAKKADRIAAEGAVIAVTNADNTAAAIVEVNSETDFVAQNDEFVAFCEGLAQTVLNENPADLDALNKTKFAGKDMTVEEALQEIFLKFRENLKIRRFARLEGTVKEYVHFNKKEGVIVAAQTEAGAADAVLECLNDVALQADAMKATYLTKEEVPAETIEQEKQIVMAQMAEDPKMANKPEQVLAKIAEGKLGVYYKENCLLAQEFVKGEGETIEQYVAACGKKAGAPIKLTSFVRFVCGEGIEKRVDDLAGEIASMLK